MGCVFHPSSGVGRDFHGCVKMVDDEKIKRFNMQPEKEKVVVICPTCSKRLRVPSTYSGTALCPTCDQKFEVEASIEEEDRKAVSKNEIHIKQGSFWAGLVIPLMPTIIMMILAIIMDDAIFFVNCTFSLCLWPIIGLYIARNVAFVESFRAGGRVSTIMGFILGGLLFMWVFSWLGDALR